jgi:caffeoyl-CoA O-methyltransferase
MNNELFESVDNYISNLVGQEDEALIAATRSLKETGMPAKPG